MSNFGTNLKRILKEKKLTARRVSKETGIPESSISEWCQGRQALANEVLVRLAAYLGVSLETLITGGDDQIKEMINAVAEQAFEVHNGVYRIKIEKIVKGK